MMNMTRNGVYRAGLASILALWLPAAVSRADADNGQYLHDAHCLACHDSSVYTRDNHFVRDMSALSSQVRRCEQSLGLKLFDDEVQDLVDYLDQNHYHFKALSAHPE